MAQIEIVLTLKKRRLYQFWLTICAAAYCLGVPAPIAARWLARTGFRIVAERTR